MVDYGHSLSFGVLLEPPDDRPLDVLQLADVAERTCLDVISLPDHPYWSDRLDTFTLLAAIAERTEWVRLFCNVANLPLRPPASLARAAATLNMLSGGRFELGIGAGAQPLWDGIVAEGGPRLSAGESVDALEEALQVIRALWGDQEGAHFSGQHYRLAGAKPSPTTVGTPDIWLGAYRPRMLRLTGRLADGWIPSSPVCGPDDLAAGNRVIDEAAQEVGRAPQSVRRGYNIAVDFGGSEKNFLEGPPKKIADELATLTLTHGISTYLLYRVATADALSRFADEVVPTVREKVNAER
jgi:alkanesulfonate monooxygenase SsuD/methylene tetrahydromethanopterin reductase-like flavin-dependent oxidoreductase (luciferase family)